MHLHIDDSRFVINEKHLFPVFAAVGCFEQTAFFTGTPKSTKHADIYDVRIRWVNRNAARLKSFFQSHVSPGFATVGRFVYAVTPGHTVSRIGFSRADPNNIRIRLCDLNISDRNRCLIIELMFKRVAVIGCFQ